MNIVTSLNVGSGSWRDDNFIKYALYDKVESHAGMKNWKQQNHLPQFSAKNLQFLHKNNLRGRGSGYTYKSMASLQLRLKQYRDISHRSWYRSLAHERIEYICNMREVGYVSFKVSGKHNCRFVLRISSFLTRRYLIENGTVLVNSFSFSLLAPTPASSGLSTKEC